MVKCSRKKGKLNGTAAQHMKNRRIIQLHEAVTVLYE